MLEDFDRLTGLVMDHIAELNHSGNMARNYAACFRELRTYLLENQTPYSPETADRWLGETEKRTTRIRFAFYRSAARMLEEMYLTGEIKIERYEFSFQTDRELSDELLAVRRDFTYWLEGRSHDTVLDKSRSCSRILLDMQNAGVHSVSEITYDTLIGELSLMKEKSYHAKVSNHAVLRLLVSFLHERGMAPYGYAVLINCMTKKGGLFPVIRLTEEEKPTLKKAAESDKTASLEEYLRIRDGICAEHVEENYSRSRLYDVRFAMDEFYLFLEANGLRYSPACGDVWLEKMKPHVDTGKYMVCRRAVSLIKERFDGTKSQLDSSCPFRENIFTRLPSWCRDDVQDFLDVKKNESLAKSTIIMYRASVCKFCESLDKAGIRDFASLTPEDIKRFNATDVHSTPKGKNEYNSCIRKFLDYLGDAGKLTNRCLYMSLPHVCAKREHIVTVLTEDEKRRVSEALSEGNTEITLRDKAMISLGLYMGLRSCDVVKLSIDDIDWDACTIRVLQDKTDKEILLPMPTKVANALYRYIMRERPESPERRIFLRKIAPFRPATREVCLEALRRVLPGRDIPGSGFHVLRKTYATNLLRNDAGVQEVAEALGHSDLSSVDKYLSLDEERMRECAFSLEKMGIAYKGGF